jgi:dTDP-4-dehydrorhamnose reductase
MKLLLLGSTGLLGTSLKKYLENSNYDFNCFVRSEKYPCNNAQEIFNALNYIIDYLKPEVIINLVAATNVDECENNLKLASLLNTEFTHLISDICRGNTTINPYIIHLSSDQVYSGPGPHNESNVNPINIYALTKLLGEYPIIRDNGCVLRTNFFGQSLIKERISFSDWLINSSKKNQPVNVFKDVLFSPLGIDSLCHAILLCVKNKISGLYNLGSNSSGVSKADFAHLLYKNLKLDESLLHHINSIDVNLKAKRPTDMRMNSDIFSIETGFLIPTIEEEIINEYRDYL